MINFSFPEKSYSVMFLLVPYSKLTNDINYEECVTPEEIIIIFIIK